MKNFEAHSNIIKLEEMSLFDLIRELEKISDDPGQENAFSLIEILEAIDNVL